MLSHSLSIIMLQYLLTHLKKIFSFLLIDSKMQSSKIKKSHNFNFVTNKTIKILIHSNCIFSKNRIKLKNKILRLSKKNNQFIASHFD